MNIHSQPKLDPVIAPARQRALEDVRQRLVAATSPDASEAVIPVDRPGWDTSRRQAPRRRAAGSRIFLLVDDLRPVWPVGKTIKDLATFIPGWINSVEELLKSLTVLPVERLLMGLGKRLYVSRGIAIDRCEPVPLLRRDGVSKQRSLG